MHQGKFLEYEFHENQVNFLFSKFQIKFSRFNFDFKVVIAKYQFYSNIFKTLPIYWFAIFEYMCEVSNLLII